MTLTEVINNILTMWKNDSEVDILKPTEELLRIPKLHSKYLDILSRYRLKNRTNDIEFKKVKKLKWNYYNGRLDEETLKKHGWEPFPYILKSDIAIYLESDDDLVNLMEKKARYEEIIELCTAIMKELNSRTYQLRSFIDYQKFISGN